jgi:cell shape-determining protein MreD
MHITISSIILLAIGIISLGLYLWNRSIFLVYSIAGGLASATLLVFLIAPLLGFRHFNLTEYWVLIPIILWCFVCEIIHIAATSSQLPKKKKDDKEAKGNNC